jgi:hypothetical protein
MTIFYISFHVCSLHLLTSLSQMAMSNAALAENRGRLLPGFVVHWIPVMAGEAAVSPLNDFLSPVSPRRQARFLGATFFAFEQTHASAFRTKQRAAGVGTIGLVILPQLFRKWRTGKCLFCLRFLNA